MGGEALALPWFTAPRPEPVAETPAVSLWPHQQRQIAAVRAEFAKADVRSTLVVSATGTGKTTMLSSVAKEQRGRVLVIAHRDPILDQLQKRLGLITGEHIEREQASYVARGGRIVVASIQTIGTGKRLRRFAPDAFSLVIVDEAHHALASTYRAVLAYFSSAKVLGVTATPDRGDRLALGQEFDSVADVYDIADAIKDKVLVPYVRERVILPVDLSQINTVAGDLNQGQLDEAMGDEHVLEGVAKPTYELAGDRQTVLFTTSVANAHLIAGILNKLRPDCARAIDGGTDVDERRRILSAYANGDFQFLANVMIATEGWDDPPTSCVSIGRPTKSRALLTQMVGRGLRVAPGKADCLIIEFTGVTERHDLASPFDILAGKYSDDEITLAKEIGDKASERQPVSVLLEFAREELAKRAARQFSYTVRKVDPFAAFEVDDPGEMDWQFGKKPPSEKQVARLLKMGIPADNLSKRQASAIIGKAIERSNKGLATYKQVAILRKNGITDPNVSFAGASAVIDALVRNRWRPLPQSQVDAILGGA